MNRKGQLCQLCFKEVTGKIGAHLRTAHKDDAEVCPECGHLTDSQEKLRLHRRIKHLRVFEEQDFYLHQSLVPAPPLSGVKECKHCSEHTLSEDPEEAEGAVGGVGVELCCPYCPRKMDSEARLRRHLCVKHGKLLPLHCPHCTKFHTTEETRLRHHLNKAHNLIDGKFKCNRCNFKSENLSETEWHEAQAHGRRLRRPPDLATWICHTCGATFPDLLSLASHKMSLHPSSSPSPSPSTSSSASQP